MMNLQTVENSARNPRISVGWGKPQFKLDRRFSAVSARRKRKTPANADNNLAVERKTFRPSPSMWSGKP